MKNGNISKEYSLTNIATIPQVRMTRCIVGAYTAKREDDHQYFEDSVGMYGNWKSTAKGEIWELPYRTLYGKNIRNLAVAGRCLSATDEHWDITRVIPVCSLSGEAAGTAATLGRDFPDVDVAQLQAALRKNGVKVISATESISEGSEGILLESVLEGIAEYYSAELSEKVVRGLTENALKCKYNGGTLPIGYTVDENQFFQIDPVAAPAVLDAFKKYAKGATMQEITDELNIKGIRTVRGTKISLNTVTRMLHNRRYIGEYAYRDTIVPNGIPAIVALDLFEQVQEKLLSLQYIRDELAAWEAK